jgi:hypothetical protein
MPTALLISAALAATIVLPISASAKEHRSASVKGEFQLTHPCPATGCTSGACPGYVKDHVVPFACGGPDAVANLQWQTIRDAKAKDKWETKAVLASRETIEEELYPGLGSNPARGEGTTAERRLADAGRGSVLTCI